MRILAIDIGTGTQDVLLFDSEAVLENCVQMVLPSPTQIVAQQVERATKTRRDLLLTGVTMGGGPCGWAVERHLAAGCRVFATPEAARTFDDDLEQVRSLGVILVDERESQRLGDVERIEMRDLDVETITSALTCFGVSPRLDGIAVALLDHGAAPPGVSDRAFRFKILREATEKTRSMFAFAHLRQNVPAVLTRMQAVASSAPTDVPLLLMDTGPAAVLGALQDRAVAKHDDVVLVNVGNMHTLGFHLHAEKIVGFFEHHTGQLSRSKLDLYLEELAKGTLTNERVFDDHGHGCLIFDKTRGSRAVPAVAVTGPQSGMLRPSRLRPYFAVPHGIMMLAGCFGLLRAFAEAVPEWREAILDRLSA
ncbi:MAG: pyruvate formate lyase-activating protein [Chloroflexota bacterium]|nr:MAG: pyruvate formate lyase-activating protein [Chloroflexota bacterium]